MQLDSLAHRAARLLKQRLDALCPGEIDEVRMYGSRARGDAREDSDLDVLVVTCGDELRIRRIVSDAVFEVYGELDYPFPISAQVMTRAHFAELVHRERLYARAVMEEGIRID